MMNIHLHTSRHAFLITWSDSTLRTADPEEGFSGPDPSSKASVGDAVRRVSSPFLSGSYQAPQQQRQQRISGSR